MPISTCTLPLTNTLANNCILLRISSFLFYFPNSSTGPDWTRYWAGSNPLSSQLSNVRGPYIWHPFFIISLLSWDVKIQTLHPASVLHSFRERQILSIGTAAATHFKILKFVRHCSFGPNSWTTSKIEQLYLSEVLTLCCAQRFSTGSSACVVCSGSLWVPHPVLCAAVLLWWFIDSQLCFRSFCPYSSAVRAGWTLRAADCGGGFQSRCRRFWSHTLTAGGSWSSGLFVLCRSLELALFHLLMIVCIKILQHFLGYQVFHLPARLIKSIYRFSVYTVKGSGSV